MPEIGLREFKKHASQILRNVRESRTRYTITYRGRPVGVLSPIQDAGEADISGEDAWLELDRLGDDITQHWRSPHTSAEILSEIRR